MLSARMLLHRLFRPRRRPDPRFSAVREVLIVRRGMSPEYYFYLQKFAAANNVELIQDRRLDDRRHRALGIEEDRRSDDRRTPPPATWSRGDVIVIRPPDAQADLSPSL